MMQVRGMLIAAFLAFSSACSTAAAQERACQDDRGIDRCDSDAQRRMREIFNLPSIERLHEQRAQVRRAFFIDGYGFEQPVVTFERRPGSEPRVSVVVWVESPQDNGRQVELTAPAPLDVWTEVLSRTTHFDRDLAPLSGNEDDICMHAWVVVVEASDPNSDRPLRSKTQNACNDGLAVGAAFSMAGHAYNLLPHCRILPLDDYRNEVTLFSACARLEGDRMAAAEAMIQFNRLHRLHQPPEPSNVALLIYDQATLEWPGEPPARGTRGGAEYWGRHMIDAELYGARFFGEGANRVRVTARLYEERGSENAARRYAPIEQIWTRENGFDFRLREMRVGALRVRG